MARVKQGIDDSDHGFGWPRRVSVYLYPNHDSDSHSMMQGLGEIAGLVGDELAKFTRGLREVKFELDVSEDGSYEIIGIKEIFDIIDLQEER